MIALPTVYALNNKKAVLTYTPPLDIVGSSVAAYSLRKLRAAYSGPAIKVRRSSDSSELDIYFFGNGLLDTASILSFTGANDAVIAVWYDQSGNARNTITPYLSYFAYIVRAGVLQTVNGLATLNFANGETSSLLAYWYTSSYTTGYTFLNVAQCSDYNYNYISNKINTSDIGCSGPLYVNYPSPFTSGQFSMRGSNGTNNGTTNIYLKNPPGLRDGFKNYLTSAVPTSSGDIIFTDFTHRIQKVNSSNVLQWKSGYGGTGNGQFDEAYALCLDASGNILVTEFGPTNYRVQKFDSSGTYISQFGSNGTANGQFLTPVDIKVDSSGNIFVVDAYAHRVSKFDSSGTYLAQLGVTAVSGTDNAHFTYPRKMAFDSSGNIYVLDTNNFRVQKFNSSLVYQSTLTGGGGGAFDYPSALAIDASNNIYVGDQTYVIKKYNSAFTWQSNFGSSGSADNQTNYINSINIDSSGNLIIADAYNSRILKWSNTGTYISKWVSNPSTQALGVYTFKGLYSSKLMNAYLNGVDNGSGTSALLADAAGTPVAIGGYENSEGATGYRGNISEVITYGTALSDVNRGLIEANQKSYYGTP